MTKETFSPKIFLLLFIFIFIFSFSVYADVGIGGGNSYGIGGKQSSDTTSTINYSTVSVNDSQFLRGYTWETYTLFKQWYNHTLAMFPFLNTASTNLQSNISAVNTSLMDYCNANFTSLNSSLKYNYNQTYTGGTYNSSYVTNTNTSWKNLTEDNMADSLHRHSELSASDGDPNPAFWIGTGGVGHFNNGAEGAGAYYDGSGEDKWFWGTDGATDVFRLYSATRAGNPISVSGTTGITTLTSLNIPQLRMTNVAPETAPVAYPNDAEAFSISYSNTLKLKFGGGNSGTYPAWIQVGNTGSNTTYPLLLNPLGGKVSIGTTSVSADYSPLLAGSGSGQQAILIYGGANSYSSLYFADGLTGASQYAGYIDYNHNTNFMAFGTSANERMRITSGGNVGIGDTDPTAKLSLGTTVSDNLLYIYEGGTNNNYGFGVASANLKIKTSSAGAISFNQEGTEKMRMHTNGYLGIGTTAPVYTLDASTASNTGIRAISSNANGESQTIVWNDQDKFTTMKHYGSTVAGNTFGIARAKQATLYSTNDNVFTIGNYWDVPLVFGIGDAEKMRINTGGNVGIGTTSPSYPLTVGNDSVSTNSSMISIWAKGNVSAGGYITRTDVFDTSKGSALDMIKDASAYRTLKGVNHSAFGYSAVKYDKQVVDKIIPTPKEVDNCTDIFDIDLNETKQICNKITIIEDVTTYKTIQEEGVSLDKEVSLLKQAIYELKVQNEYLQQQINNLKGQDINLSKVNDVQNEAICSIKIFAWCIK